MRGQHLPIVYQFGPGLAWLATCSCGQYRSTHQTEAGARAAHGEHRAFRSIPEGWPPSDAA